MLEERLWAVFGACAGLCALLTVATNACTQANPHRVDGFHQFQRTFLVVYLLAMFADWLQGPYVYQLYASYGFSELRIAQLFVCGFLSRYANASRVLAWVEWCS
jgi:hypothetical protein